MYSLYTPYGGFISRIFWWAFRHFYLIRWLNRIDSSKVPFDYDIISTIAGKNTIMSFNLGTPGPEQKISILGFEGDCRKKFFAKFSKKEKAKELTRNEISIFHALEGTKLTPDIIETIDTGNYIWLKTSIIEGSQRKTTILTKDIVDLSLIISQKHIKSDSKYNLELRTCLSHGDFCPWNMIINGDKIKMIDWEMAAERPLGYDLFKYLNQCSKLLNHSQQKTEFITGNTDLINYYFTEMGISNWEDYYYYYLSSIEEKHTQKHQA